MNVFCHGFQIPKPDTQSDWGCVNICTFCSPGLTLSGTMIGPAVKFENQPPQQEFFLTAHTSPAWPQSPEEKEGSSHLRGDSLLNFRGFSPKIIH